MTESKKTENNLTLDTNPYTDNHKTRKREKLSTRNQMHAKAWNDALNKMPLGLGSAYSENDCFFDAIVQVLPLDTLKESKSSDALSRLKWLRTICSQEANKIHQMDTENNWIKQWDTWQNSDVSYEKYLSHIQYAMHEVNGHGVKDTDILRGDPDIDGRLLCAYFKLKIHVMGWDETTGQIVHKIVSNDFDNPIDSVEPHEVDYNDTNLVHIAHYKDHFVPLIPHGEKFILLVKKSEAPENEPKKFSNIEEEQPIPIPKSESLSTPSTNKPKDKKVLVTDDTVINGTKVPILATSPITKTNEIKKPENKLQLTEDAETLHLKALASALEKGKSNTKELEATFAVLYENCTSLSVDGWSQFLPLVHAYVSRCLPERTVLYNHYQHKTGFEIQTHTRDLLKQYEQIGAYVQQILDYQEWRDFYQNAYLCLIQKGFYRPEIWLGDKVQATEKEKPFDETKAQERCQTNLSLKEYYDVLVEHLSAYMEVAIIIATGRIDPVKSTSQSVATSAIGQAIPYMLSNIPIAGWVISGITVSTQTIIEFACKLKEQGKAAHVRAWAPTDKDQMVKAIALRLTLLRESTLLSPTTPGFFTKASTWFKGVQEDKTFNPAEALALKDCDAVLTLLQQHTPNKQLWRGSAEWFRINADFIATQFNLQITKPDPTPAIAQPTPSSINTAWPAAIFYQWGSFAELDWSARIHNNDTQALDDGRMECRAGWEKLWNYIDKTNLNALISFQNIVLHELMTPFLAWGESECQTIVNQYLRPLWSEKLGLKVLTQAVKAASQQPWSSWKATHEALLTALKNLRSQDPPLAQNIYHHYRLDLAGWGLQVKKVHDQQAAELKKLDAEEKILKERYDQWMKGFQEKCQELVFDFETILAFPASTGEFHDSYLKPEPFCDQALEIWRKGGKFEELESKSHGCESVWETACAQGWPQAAALHQALAYSFQQARRKIITAMEANQHERNLRREILEKQQSEYKTTAEALNLALSQKIEDHKNNQSTHLSSIPVSHLIKEEKKSASQPRSFRERQAQFWQHALDTTRALEQQYPPPCGFSVIVWPVDCPYSGEQWQWGLLVTNAKEKNNPYWQWYARLLNGRLAVLTQSLALPMKWVISSDNPYSPLMDPDSLTPYRHGGRCLTTSTVDSEEAQKLWGIFQQQAESRLSTLLPLKEQKITLGKALGQGNMKSLLASLLPAFEELEPGAKTCNPANTLLHPLLLWLYNAASFYGLAPDTPEELLTQLQTQGHLHADFVADLRAAYTWATTKTEALHDAWFYEKAPRGLKPGQARVQADGETIPLGQNDAFYLTSSEYLKHHRYTLEVLQQTWDDTYGRWDSSEKIVHALDPLEIHCKHLMEQATKPEFNDRQAFILLNKIIPIILHRPSLQQAPWLIPLFLSLKESRQLHFLKQLTPHFSYEEQAATDGLIYRLNNIPTSSGRRARWAQEQIEWRDQILPKLWSESKKIETTPLIEISVVRQVRHNRQWIWKTQKFPLNPNVANKLFDPKGQWRPKDEKIPGNHRVFPIEIEGQRFWIKAYPEQPAMEWIVHQLDRRLGVFGTPRFEVVKFHHGNQTSCALISEHIIGDTLKTVLKEEPDRLNDLEFISFARTLLRVLLTNPEDDKDDDYILEMQPNGKLHLKRIDNERAFFEPLVEEGNFLFKKTTLQVKSIVYCLEQMRQNWPREPGVQDLLEEWQKMDFIDLLQDLFEQANQTHTAWCELFSLDEIKYHFQLPELDKGLILMCIPSELTTEIIDRMTLLQESLELAMMPKTPAEIKQSSPYSLSGLTLLHDTQPKLGEYYGRAYSVSLALKEHKINDITEIPRQHDRSYRRFTEYVGSHYQKNVRREYKTNIGASQAFQKTLRLEIPLTFEDLTEIWHSKKYSPKQALAEINALQKKDLKNLSEKILTPKDKFLYELKKLIQNKEVNTIESEQLWQGYQTNLAKKFRELPLRQRGKMCLDFHKQLSANQLNLQQQAVILDAMTGAGWPDLDLSVFSPELITNERVTLLLKGTLEAKPLVGLTTLNISGCSHLTEDILKIIQNTCHNSLKHLNCNYLLWRSVTLSGFDELLYFECKESKQLAQLTLDLNKKSKLRSIDLTNSGIQIISGIAPQLTTLRLNNCEQLQHIGERGYLFNRPLSTPQLQQLNITQCINLEGLCLSSSLFYNVFIPHLISFPKLQSIELQTDSGEWVRADFLLPPLKTRSSVLDYSYEDRLVPEQIKVLAAYLPHDIYFTVLDLINAQLDDQSITLLSQGLAQNRTITHLDLSGNNITVRGSKALGKMLQSNTSLVSLDLWGNNINWHGVGAIAEAMQTNTTLQEFRHHYAHYKPEIWNKSSKKRWIEEGDYIKRVREFKRLSSSNFFALNRSSPLASEEKQSPISSTTSSSRSIALTAPTPIADKSSMSFLDEKDKTKFLKLQDRLVAACEKGNLAAVKKAIRKGAQVDQANAKGKWPLYAAVYGMNPELVRYVIAQLAEKTPISWKACEEHNKHHYGQTFLIMKFAPVFYKDWYELLLKIEPNEFLAGYHLAQGERIDVKPRGYGYRNLTEVVARVAADEMQYGEIGIPRAQYSLGGRRMWLSLSQAPRFEKTEAGYEVNRNQIKQAIETLQEVQTKQRSVNYYTTSL